MYYKFIYSGFPVLYCSKDICEEKFLAYFWWCYDRLKVILSLCFFLHRNSSINLVVIMRVIERRMIFDSKIKQEAFCS
jgi:hypothetical protein